MGLLALGATSCTDWLTLYPQDRVVEENFWEDKNDLEGVRYAAYQQMASTLEKLIIWGDIRSDNYELSPLRTNQMGNYDIYQRIQNAQLDSTMSQYDWGGVYTTINFCNKVLSHGAEVLERDPQFTATEWKEMEAEMKALRALNYFYLIRAFKDIPYSTMVINADEETMNFPLVNQLAVLDTLIMDVRPVAGKARNRFTSTSDTKGMMTNSAIYALLADMYLWRSALREGRGFDAMKVEADLDSVIYFGQQSIIALNEQNDMANASYGSSRSKSEDFGSGLTGALLITNEDMAAAYKAGVGASPIVDSYRSIFSQGNSDESIFELQFPSADERKSTFIYSFFGNGDGHHFVVNGNLIATLYANESDDANKEGKRDSRMWYCAQTLLEGQSTPETRPLILKYSDCEFMMKDDKDVMGYPSESDYNNWIIYRLTDVMLMIAEAHVCKAKGASNKDVDFVAAENIVDAIHKRSTVGELVPKTPAGTKNSALKEAFLKLVMNERQMELLGEGRRWFDLVRYAERYARYDMLQDINGNDSVDITNGALIPDPREPEYWDGTRGVRKMIADFLGKAFPKDEQTLKNRIKNRYGLYSPIYYMEKKANHGTIEQNPVWDREK